MIEIYKTSLLRLNHNYQYTFETFKKRGSIFIYGIEYVGDDPWERQISEINYWFKIKNNYKSKIQIFFQNSSLVIPMKLVFGKLEDWELFMYLAIISYEEPTILFEYYEIGEFLDYGTSREVTLNNKMVKSLFCYNEGEKTPLKLFAIKRLKKFSSIKLNSIYKEYFNETQEILEMLSEAREEISRKKSNSMKEDSFNDNNYNDGLDMDQQNPEFWDSQ